MLTKDLFRSIQCARGLSAEEIVAKTGIPAQSFMILISENKSEKDPNKLISSLSINNLVKVLGLKAMMDGLSPDGVIEWRVPAAKKSRKDWLESVSHIRSELMGDTVRVAVLVKKPKMLRAYESALFFYDPTSNVKIVATRVDRDTQKKLLAIFGEPSPRVSQVEEEEYELTCDLVANSVYRIHQFLIVLGGKTVRYTWGDVQAAAKEFNFTPDNLVEMMVQRIDADRKKESTPLGLVGTDDQDFPVVRQIAAVG